MLLCCFVALLLIRAKRPCTLARLDAPQHTHTHTFTHTHTLSHTCPCTSLCRCLAHRCGRRFVSCCRTTTARRATLLSSHVRCVPTCAAPSPTLLVCCWYLGSSLHYSSPPPPFTPPEPVPDRSSHGIGDCARGPARARPPAARARIHRQRRRRDANRRSSALSQPVVQQGLYTGAVVVHG